eukprot:TRINITY_DN17068_c1_g1_i1.p1 TRINITY_DN17068_c1_g1~~TRINITY_DN17068_c1_g1_i1.p1  ORF type:complete len:869 (-),score=184.75 TRINITY_DN17068_c1_g1_i1:69-2675(-)
MAVSPRDTAHRAPTQAHQPAQLSPRERGADTTFVSPPPSPRSAREAAGSLSVVGAGDGGIDELSTWLSDDLVMWALVRFNLGSGTLKRQKLLFLHFNGDDCPVMKRGKANELTYEAQRVLRGEAVAATAASTPGFHASIEEKRRENITTESVLERIRKVFVADDGDYSVKQVLKDYEDEIARRKREKPKAADKVIDEKTGAVRCPGHNSVVGFQTGRDALRAVGEPLGPWNWLLIGPDPVNLPVVAGGDGSYDELRDCIAENDDKVLFGMLRMGFGEGRLRRTKYVFIHSNGPSMGAVKRGRFSAARPDMERAFSAFATCSTPIEIMGVEEFLLEDIIERVKKAAIVDEEVLEGDSNNKSAYTVEAFREALREERKILESAPAILEDASGKKAPGADLEVLDAVKLIHAPDGPLNWALFVPSPDVFGRRSLSPRPTAGHRFAPSDCFIAPGGYVAAAERRSLAAGGRKSLAERKSVTSRRTLTVPGVGIDALLEASGSNTPSPPNSPAHSWGGLTTPPNSPPRTPRTPRDLRPPAGAGSTSSLGGYTSATEPKEKDPPPSTASTTPASMPTPAPASAPTPVPAPAPTPAAKTDAFGMDNCDPITTRDANDAIISSNDDNNNNNNSGTDVNNDNRSAAEAEAEADSSAPAPAALDTSTQPAAVPTPGDQPADIGSSVATPEAARPALESVVEETASQGSSPKRQDTTPAIAPWAKAASGSVRDMKMRTKTQESRMTAVKSTRPPLMGPLLKESSHWLRGWQLRWFECYEGELRWWETPSQYHAGEAPKGKLQMKGLKVGLMPGSATKMEVKASNEKGKVYTLDANTAKKVSKAGWDASAVSLSVMLTAKDWISRLQREAIYARNTENSP